MQRFTNILFSPLTPDGAEAAFARVARLAALNRGRVRVMGVTPEPSALQRMLHPWPGDRPVDVVLTDQLVEDLRRWCRTEHDLPVQITAVTGNPALRLIEAVLRDDHDLLVVTSGSDRRSHATVKRLLRKCPCPVFVVRPLPDGTRRLLAAVDPEPGDTELNRLILELAGSLATLLDAELHVVHAWELYGEATMRSSAFLHVDDDEIDAMRRRVETEEREAVEELVADVIGHDRAEIHVVEGPAGEVIPALVDDIGITGLVMGTLARAGVPGLVMGNTAEQILDAVSCSVLAVKPPGFVSPITVPPS